LATFRVLRWGDIPSLVEAWDGDDTVRVPLSQRFQDLIDGVAMRQGAHDSDAYLEAWDQGPETERPGSAAEVASSVAAELEAAFADYVARHLR
jgi:hypothetical protein